MARLLAVKPEWLAVEATAGRIPAVRVGETFLFNDIAVREALLKRATRPAAPAGAAR
jgi:hypothetical protein